MQIIKAVVFDLDGVIINSNPEIEKFWHYWAAKAGINLTNEHINQHIYGRKGAETIDALFSHVSDATKKEIIETAIVFDSQMNPRAIDGIVNFIRYLQSINIPIGIVTSSHKQRAIVMLAKHNLSGSFRAMVTAEDVTKGKPDPQPYILISRKLQINAVYCLVFEDAISGVQSAKAAGMPVIGINTEHEAKALLASGAADAVNDFSKLKITANKISTSFGKTFQLETTS